MMIGDVLLLQDEEKRMMIYACDEYDVYDDDDDIGYNVDNVL